MYEYENMSRIAYGSQDDEYGQAIFIPVCQTCGRFVKADKEIKLQGGTLADQPNADCKKCGRTKMLFEGFF